jgi:predicted small lipoprotein YifL
LLVTVLLSGCGIKGALYLPEDENQLIVPQPLISSSQEAIDTSSKTDPADTKEVLMTESEDETKTELKEEKTEATKSKQTTVLTEKQNNVN